MRHIFLINPMAGGKGSDTSALIEQIKTVCERRAADYLIYLTTGIGDATEAARGFSREATAENPVRLYACGGDGTLSEVAHGRFAPEYVGEILASRSREFAGMTAPPEGLYLNRVFY